jgi:hypothetical protein
VARLPSFKKILAETWPELKWMPEFARPINQFFSEASNALNKNLTINENFSGKLLTVELDGTVVKVPWDLPVKPLSVLVGNVYKSDGTSFTLSSAVQVQWSYNQSDQIQIDAVTGITPSATAKYKLVLEIKTG